jgi:hypothetical protein
MLLTAAVEAKEGQDMMTANIPNAFVQTNIEVDNNEKMLMKIHGTLVDMLTKLDPELYLSYVVQENDKKVLYEQSYMVHFKHLYYFIKSLKKI